MAGPEDEKQKLKQRPWHNAITGLHLLARSACFLRQLKNTCPGVSTKPPTVGQVLPRQSLITKTPHRLDYRPI